MTTQRSPRFILFALAFGVFVAADDLTVVSTMLRQIVFDLEIPLPDGLDQAAWIVNAYLIAYVVVMPFTGKLSDLFGRKRIYLFSLILFLVGSIWVILPFSPITSNFVEPSFNFFLIGRVITALGGGAMVPVSMAIIADIYAPEKRASALGILGAIDTAGWVWGPLYGALLVRYLSWEWQFYLNIPLTIIGIVLIMVALRDLEEPVVTTPIDWVGAALLTICLLTLNIALLNSGDISAAGGFADFEAESKVSTMPLYLTALASFLLFVFYERRLQNGGSTPPLISPALFTLPNFTLAILVNFIIGSTLIIAMVNVPLVINVLEIEVGSAAITSGWLLSTMTGAMAVMAYVGGQWTERQGIRPPTLAGLL
ncbi:MAG: MFS transporter, partial [Candidatus Promineifilaceae bacterium]